MSGYGPTGGRRFGDPQELCDALGLPFSGEQLDAICAPLEPGVIIAGAGTGKTTVMAARVVWLVGTGQVAPQEVLGLTFTRKAAAELASRIRSSLTRSGISATSHDEGEEVILTYDAFAARLVAEHGLRLGIEPAPVMIAGAARYRLASQVVRAATGPFSFLSRLRPATVAERVLQLDSALASHLVSPGQVRDHAQSFAADLELAPSNNRGNVYVSVQDAIAALLERLELVGLVEDYRRSKAQRGYTEFADQLAAAVRLVREAPTVAELMRDQFKVVLLDEYQDTSSAQAELLKGLFPGHPVTAVGDPFQAIYGWRGAAASNITTFAHDFPRAAGHPAMGYRLSVNRRSRAQILDVANEIGSQLRASAATEGTLAGLLRAPEDGGSGVVVAAGFDTAESELAWLAESIADQGRDPAVRWSDTAILVRRNADIGGIYEALSDRDVPVEIVGLGGLLSLSEIAVVLSTLHLLHDITSNADLVNLLAGPRWQIGTADLAALGRRARQIARAANPKPDTPNLATDLDWLLAGTDTSERLCLFDALLDPGQAELSHPGTRRIQAFVKEFGWLQRHAHEPVPDLVRRVIATLGLEVEIAVHGARRRHDAAAQLARFLEAVADYVELDAEASLAGLLAYFEAEVSHGEGLEQATPSEQNSVKVLTVHKAKGLEWERVYLPHLADKVFPSDRGSDNHLRQAAAIPAPLRGDAGSIPQLGEVSDPGIKAYREQLRIEQQLAEDRLAYVAVTRAKSYLAASWHVWSPGTVRPKCPSRYFSAIREEALRQGRVVAEAPPPGGHNPIGWAGAPAAWPHPLDEALAEERRRAAAWVEQARGHQGPDEPMSAEAAALVGLWDQDLDLLIARARESDRSAIEVRIPESLSVTSATRLQDDPQAWAAQEVRPMPKPPSRGAHIGNRFHAWVQRRYEMAALFDDEEHTMEPDSVLSRLTEAFERGPYANRTPIAVEVPFVLRLGHHVIRGRIDAVYRGASGDQVVDWKTSNRGADPRQLAYYRLAWARATGQDPERVDAVFYHVPSGEVRRAGRLDDEAALVAALDQR